MPRVCWTAGTSGRSSDACSDEREGAPGIVTAMQREAGASC